METELMSGIVEKAKHYAINCHEGTNHKYGKELPYSFHLEMVYNIGKKFIHLIPEVRRDDVLAGCWVHDTIEDCRQTYNDVKNATNETVAELAYSLTNEKGKNRAERANDNYYLGIKSTPNAVFIKLCDRIANIQYSKDTGSSMFNKYVKENEHFVKSLYMPYYEEMFETLRQICLDLPN